MASSEGILAAVGGLAEIKTVGWLRLRPGPPMDRGVVGTVATPVEEEEEEEEEGHEEEVEDERGPLLVRSTAVVELLL